MSTEWVLLDLFILRTGSYWISWSQQHTLNTTTLIKVENLVILLRNVLRRSLLIDIHPQPIFLTLLYGESVNQLLSAERLWNWRFFDTKLLLFTSGCYHFTGMRLLVTANILSVASTVRPLASLCFPLYEEGQTGGQFLCIVHIWQ